MMNVDAFARSLIRAFPIPVWHDSKFIKEKGGVGKEAAHPYCEGCIKNRKGSFLIDGRTCLCSLMPRSTFLCEKELRQSSQDVTLQQSIQSYITLPHTTTQNSSIEDAAYRQ